MITEEPSQVSFMYLNLERQNTDPWGKKRIYAIYQCRTRTEKGTYNIATDSGDTLDREIERLYIALKSRSVEERHNKRPKAAVDVQTDIRFLCEFTKCRDRILLIRLRPYYGKRWLTTAPSGKLGAEPTIMIVLIFLPISEKPYN